MIEAGVAIARSFCCFGIYLREVSKHSFNRGVQTIEIETIETDFVVAVG
jgi:hypothetical protein